METKWEKFRGYFFIVLMIISFGLLAGLPEDFDHHLNLKILIVLIITFLIPILFIGRYAGDTKKDRSVEAAIFYLIGILASFLYGYYYQFL